MWAERVSVTLRVLRVIWGLKWKRKTHQIPGNNTLEDRIWTDDLRQRKTARRRPNTLTSPSGWTRGGTTLSLIPETTPSLSRSGRRQVYPARSKNNTKKNVTVNPERGWRLGGDGIDSIYLCLSVLGLSSRANFSTMGWFPSSLIAIHSR